MFNQCEINLESQEYLSQIGNSQNKSKAKHKIYCLQNFKFNETDIQATKINPSHRDKQSFRI